MAASKHDLRDALRAAEKARGFLSQAKSTIGEARKVFLRYKYPLLDWNNLGEILNKDSTYAPYHKELQAALVAVEAALVRAESACEKLANVVNPNQSP